MMADRTTRERMARAMARVHAQATPATEASIEAMVDEDWPDYLVLVDAGLSELREPDVAVISAGADAESEVIDRERVVEHDTELLDDQATFLAGWRAAIDAISGGEG